MDESKQTGVDQTVARVPASRARQGRRRLKSCASKQTRGLSHDGIAAPNANPEPDTDDDPRIGKWRRIRQRSFNRFARAQIQNRRWIALAELTGCFPDSDKGYEHLARAIIIGFFQGANAKSQVMYLNPYHHLGSAIEGEIGIWPKDSHRRFVLRLTSSILQKYLELTPPSAIKVVLSQCFVPSELGKRWLDAHGLKAPDYWFRRTVREPLESHRSHGAQNPRRKHMGKREKLIKEFLALHKEGDNICSPVSVQEQHTRALKKAGIPHDKVSDRTIQRARKAALEEINQC